MMNNGLSKFVCTVGINKIGKTKRIFPSFLGFCNQDDFFNWDGEKRQDLPWSSLMGGGGGGIILAVIR